MQTGRLMVPSIPSSPANPPQATTIKVAHVVDSGKPLPANASQWLEENRSAIAHWNAYFEEYGLPLARYRQF